MKRQHQRYIKDSITPRLKKYLNQNEPSVNGVRHRKSYDPQLVRNTNNKSDKYISLLTLYNAVYFSPLVKYAVMKTLHYIYDFKYFTAV